jgi:undecaprenyl-diphosphatase
MNLLDVLKLWDTNLFLLINGIHAPIFDGIMFAISAKFVWIPFYIAIVY